jgi:hypothetical protein
MAKILLISEERVKETTNISDNLSGKYLQSAMREAQEVDYRGIIGSCLLDVLKAKVADGTLNGDYKMLVDESQDFLAFTTRAKLPMMLSYKLTNFGLAKSNDENLQVATMDEIVADAAFYQAKADAACARLQAWLRENRALYPELSVCKCGAVRPNLTESVDVCGILLEGARGKIVRR